MGYYRLGDLRRNTPELQVGEKAKRETPMARIVMIGLDQMLAQQLGYALAPGQHKITHKQKNVASDDLVQADLVFANGEGKQYLPVLKRVREKHPTLPFVVVTRVPETSDWLDALEAGATDYCSSPFDSKHMDWLMETALPAHRVAVA
jgi:DNA-binding response OmpR family regulator